MPPHPLPSKTDALTRRYGPEAVPAAGPWNDVVAHLLDHRSVRGYRSDPLPAGTLETLVAAAQSAATSSNMQTWSVVAVTDPALKAAFAQIAAKQKHIEQCPLFLVWVADLSRAERLGKAEGTPLEALPYLETFLVASIDAALAAQNAVVAAESFGLSTVYIGALRNDVEAVARHLALPPGSFGVFGLCVGYADPAAVSEVKPRLPQAAILHHDRYAPRDETVHRAVYDRALSEFSRRHEMAQYSWTERVITRLGKAASLQGRDRLRGALAALGLPLR
ncbi:MAG: NADPH-dependent oxidoreductase [Alphaproteobacteria bacterium]|nr:NADPH-dependent oxidoreductase [Alphaproteobacteria bacterium]